jgi:hypothetical protein
MIDSYEAPANLAEARKKAEAVVAGRQAGHGVDAGERGALASNDDQTVVTLKGKRFDQTSSLDGAEVVIADLVLWRWDEASVRSLAKQLPPGALLVFVEPTADLGWRRGVHRMTKNLWWAALRHNFESDVPARLRAAGLLVTTTDRFSVGPAGIKSYVWGIAEHMQPSAGADGS